MHCDGDNVDFFKRFLSYDRRPEEMKKVNLVDFDRLLAQIAPENPSGEKDLEYDPAFVELEKKIGGISEVEIGGKIVQDAQAPNWHEIQDDAVELLARTHDLRVAVSLTRALLNTEGLIGLGAGLSLLQGLIERYWETLYPRLAPEDNHDPTQRINILMTLCDREAMISPLLGVTLCLSPAMGSYTLRDIQKATGKLAVSDKNDKPAPLLAAIEAAFKDCDLKLLQAEREAVGESLLRLSILENLLKEKVGPSIAPRFDDLRHVLNETDRALEKQIAKHPSSTPSAPKKKIEPQVSPLTSKGPFGQTASSQKVNPMDTINSRQDVTRILDQICLYYEKNEPASPVPLLLKRAARLVDKDFFEIIQDVAPESVDQIQKLIGGAKDKVS
jgi:type VI secretion system protein ImpA